MKTKARIPLLSLTPNQRGALWLLGTSAVFTLMNAVIKYLGPAIPTSQVVLFRSAFGLVALLPFILSDPRGALAISRPGLHLFRAVLGLIAMSANFWTVAVLPLATATSLFFTKPLFMPILAVFLLKERFRWRRGLATAGGFLGVLVMLDPDSGTGPWPIAIGLAGAACVALIMVVIKKLTATERPLAVLVWFSVLSSIGIAPLAAWVWVTPSLDQLLLLMSLGGLGSWGQYMMIRAYRVGEAQAITPVDYTQLLFAGVLGMVLFGELPGLRMLLGIAIIVGATLYITLCEEKPLPPPTVSGDLL
ncbi:MAG: DMT family transporter [Alphaproteobacteria bacterium]|nr:DMT family transporter [Alphaproteobacteria bacterium]